MGEFVIAFSIVNVENNKNWLWFLQKLKKSIFAFHLNGLIDAVNLAFRTCKYNIILSFAFIFECMSEQLSHVLNLENSTCTCK
uniref:MULE transposase domain-containing protein n=1 Tax=Physcomitrium patens TaxID=3218 RepID=A0A2K1L054_PHYPA|nr:hypothetical protein PHYPA_002197 [Physcomitrium patens]